MLSPASTQNFMNCNNCILSETVDFNKRKLISMVHVISKDAKIVRTWAGWIVLCIDQKITANRE